MPRHHLAKGGDEIVGEDGLVEKIGIGRQVAGTRTGLAGDDQHADLRPALPDEAGEFETVHGSRHVHVGEHSADIRTPLQQLESLVGILRLDDPDFRFA